MPRFSELEPIPTKGGHQEQRRGGRIGGGGVVVGMGLDWAAVFATRIFLSCMSNVAFIQLILLEAKISMVTCTIKLSQLAELV